MKNSWRTKFATAVLSVALPVSVISPLATARPVSNPIEQQSSADSLCDSDIPKSNDPELNGAKVAKLLSDSSFTSTALESSSNPVQVASDVSDYFTLQEVDSLILDGLNKNSPEVKPKVQNKIRPFDLKCGKARAGWALYQAQGFLVCAPASVVNALAGAVCNIAKMAGGRAINFNQLCD